MTAPHFHTAAEAKKAIDRISHNADGGKGAPTGISGGSSGNMTTKTPMVQNTESQGDGANKRKL